jgi:hypothetical protein
MEKSALIRLAQPLVILLIVLIAGIAGIRYAQGQLKQRESRLTAQDSLLNEARKRYLDSDQEKETILRFLPAYQELQRTGVLAPEQRINWLESIRAVNGKVGLFSVEYQLDPQRDYPRASELNAGQLRIQHSPMKLRLGLLHEGDFLKFFGDLAADRSGLFALNRCRLSRVGVGAPGQAPNTGPNIDAECQLSWITVFAEPKREKS